MQAHTKMTSRSNGARWTGRAISALCVLFLLFDGLTKAAMERHVLQALSQAGYQPGVALPLGYHRLDLHLPLRDSPDVHSRGRPVDWVAGGRSRFHGPHGRAGTPLSLPGHLRGPRLVGAVLKGRPAATVPAGLGKRGRPGAIKRIWIASSEKKRGPATGLCGPLGFVSRRIRRSVAHPQTWISRCGPPCRMGHLDRPSRA